MSTFRILQAFGLCLVASFGLSAERPPNLLLILADDVGREVLGCYGGTSYETPHLDRLARRGLKFDHAYSMPVCHPSRVCLLTGRYPRSLGNPGWGTFPVSEQNHTLAAVLQRSGYATAVAGKWQLQLLKKNPQHPHQLGFDQYALFGWHEGPRYHQPMIYQNGRVRTDVRDRYGPDVYVDFLVDFMADHRDRPFFAWYSMALCHDVSDDLPTPPPFYKDQRWMTYHEMAESMDRQVGKLLAALDRLGLQESTLVLFTADNGTAKSSYIDVRKGRMRKEPVHSMMRGRRVRGGKGELSDWGTRVPLLARWPGTIAPGQTVDDLVDFSDFLPTLAELAGARPPAIPLDGVSFAHRLLGKGKSPRSWAYSEAGNGSRFWVRTADYKLYNDGRFFAMDDSGEETGPMAPTTLPGRAETDYTLLRRALARVKR